MDTPKPPRWPLRLLERICSDRQLEILYGDVLEIFEDRVKSLGYTRALLWFFWDVLSLIRPFAMKKPSTFNLQPTVSLFQNYLMTTLRGFARNRLSFLINFLGLTVGFFAVLVLSQHILFELSYDQFHPNRDDLYRISYQRWEQNELTFNGATTFLPVGPMLVERYAEVTGQCRFYYPFTHAVFSYNDEAFHEEKPVFADGSFFELFGFELLQGDPDEVLEARNRVVLSERMANTYFGVSEPLGKVLKFTFEDGETDLVVAGVMANPRPDSHLQFDVLMSFSTLDQWPIFQDNDWRFPFYHTYVRLSPQMSPEDLEMGAIDLLSQFRPGDKQGGEEDRVLLQSVTDIHLDSHLTFELGQNGDRGVIHLLMLVAALIIVIAYFNYVNLATALSTLRGKEVGVRKVMGSHRGQIISRFVIEALVVNVLALLLSVAGLWLCRGILQRMLQLDLVITEDGRFWVAVVGVVMLGALISSLYPAVLSAAHRPATIFRGSLSLKTKGGGLRKVLIGSQFAISVAMIGSVVLISQQTNYLMNKDLGFDADKILVLSAPHVNDNASMALERLGNELLGHPDVEGYTASNSVPGRVMSSGSIKRMDRSTAEAVPVHFVTIDADYFETYGIDLAQGRSFVPSSQADRSKVVINEAAARALGFATLKEAIGAELSVGDRLVVEVLGVVRDYHHSSLKTDFEPMIFSMFFGTPVYLSLKIASKDLPATLVVIETVMQSHFPNDPFEFFFLDQAFDQEFKAELQYGHVLKAFSLLAIVLAGLGLFGLASFLLIDRTKEIGIRKVLGATLRDFWRLLGDHFVAPLVIGCLLAFVALYVLGTWWLAGFAFRVNMGPTIFLVPFCLVTLLAVLTLGVLTWRTSRIDPARILKDE